MIGLVQGGGGAGVACMAATGWSQWRADAAKASVAHPKTREDDVEANGRPVS